MQVMDEWMGGWRFAGSEDGGSAREVQTVDGICVVWQLVTTRDGRNDDGVRWQ